MYFLNNKYLQWFGDFMNITYNINQVYESLKYKEVDFYEKYVNRINNQ